MRIYFSAARAYREEFGENYALIREVLKKTGLPVVDNGRLTQPSGAFNNLNRQERMALYRQMVKNIDKSDVCVFEASFPSTIHIGHEITVALEKGKPVIVLYTVGHEPILFNGIPEKKLVWVEYNEKNLAKKLADVIELAKRQMDVRFNFFVSPGILSYLDWIAKQRMIPRSVFLRDLIEKEMKKDREFGK